MCLGVVQTMPSTHSSLHKLAFSTTDARLVYYGELEHSLQHGSMSFINYFDRKWCWKQQFMEQHLHQWEWIDRWLLLFKILRMKGFGWLYTFCWMQCIVIMWFKIQPWIRLIISHLTKRAENTIFKLGHDLDDEKKFGHSGSAAIAGCDEEREKIFGSYEESEDNDDKRYVLFYYSTYLYIFLANMKWYSRCRKWHWWGNHEHKYFCSLG